MFLLFIFDKIQHFNAYKNILRSHFRQVIYIFFSAWKRVTFRCLFLARYFREAPGKLLQVSVVENSRSAPFKGTPGPRITTLERPATFTVTDMLRNFLLCFQVNRIKHPRSSVTTGFTHIAYCRPFACDTPGSENANRK